MIEFLNPYASVDLGNPFRGEGGKFGQEGEQVLPAGTQDRLRDVGKTKAEIDEMTWEDADRVLQEHERRGKVKAETAPKYPGLERMTQEERNRIAREEAQRDYEALGFPRRRKTDVKLLDPASLGAISLALYTAGASEHQGLLVSFWVELPIATALAVPGGEPPEKMHVTLCYCGDVEQLGDVGVAQALLAVELLAQLTAPMRCQVGPVGRFPATEHSDNKDVLFAHVKCPSLLTFRKVLARYLTDVGVPPRGDFEYTPHLTLKYVEPDSDETLTVPDDLMLVFDAVTVSVGEARTDIPLGRGMRLLGNPHKGEGGRFSTAEESNPATETRAHGTMVSKSKFGTVAIVRTKDDAPPRYLGRRKSGEAVGTFKTVRHAKDALREPENRESFPSGYRSPDVAWKELTGDDDYEVHDCTYREKIALLGNPFKGEGGRFASSDEATGGNGNGARYYTTKEGDKYVVHDRLYSERGDPYRREFKSKEQAESKREGLEDKYGQQEAWLKIRGEATPGRARPPAPSGDTPATPSMKVTAQGWESASGSDASGDYKGTVKRDDKMGGGMNVSRRVVIETPQGDVDGIFKPTDGERWASVKRDGPIRLSVYQQDGSMAARELVASEVDRALGTNLVPKTAKVKVGQHEGSHTEFVSDAKTYATHEGATNKDDWYKMAVLDLMVGNTDRHTKQVMVTKDGRLKALDHGLAFPRDDSEFKFRMIGEVPEKGSPATRKALLAAIDRTDWNKIVKPLGSPARRAFAARLSEVRKALKEDSVYDLLTTKAAKKKRKK